MASIVNLSFERELQKLGELLEENPDPWFRKPKGWLKKPDFKRAAQENIVIEDPSSASNPEEGGSYAGYRQRYFVLDLEKFRLVYFKNSEPGCPESGSLDLVYITAVEPSSVFDAPENSIDLVSSERHYTLVADSKATILRWAYAFRLALKSATNSSGARRNSKTILENADKKSPQALEETDRWLRYDVEYEEPGPLMLNVMGSASYNSQNKVTNKWVVVTSFENYPDGRRGRSEATGLISVKDMIVGVNGVDITKMDFNNAMQAIINAKWPKTIHFLRDNLKSTEHAVVEGWAFVMYSALNKKRRRYVELMKESINFRKPDPGGAACDNRDSFIDIRHITEVKPIIDKNLPSDQMYVLHCICGRSAVMQTVDMNDEVCSTSAIDVVELCFGKQQQMNAWRSTLASIPVVNSDGTSDIHNIRVLPIQTIEAVVLTTDRNNNCVMGLKNNLSGKFSEREFYFKEGCLYWKRPKADQGYGHRGASIQRIRQMFIANSSSCLLRSVRVQFDSSQIQFGFQYQISVQTMVEENGEIMLENTTIGMGSEEICMQWLNAFREVVNVSPRAGHVHIPGIDDVRQAVNRDEQINNAAAGEDGGDRITGYIANAGERVTQGWLFKRSDASSPVKQPKPTSDLDYNLPLSPRTEKYRRRWYVLVDFRLSYFKSPAEACKQDLALGFIDLRTAVEVREASEFGAPVNSIEIVCGNGRSYLLVGEDEDEALRWLDALNDTLETRTMAAQSISADVVDEQEIFQRIVEKRQSIVLDGELSMKSVNRLTSVVTWKDRYFVIANGVISYYDKQEHFFDDDKDSLGEISLYSVFHVESTKDGECPEGCGLDVHAFVTRGGDANGVRIFTLAAADIDTCRRWMDGICSANGTLVLREEPEASGHFESVKSADLVRKQGEQKRKTSIVYAKESTINKVHRDKETDEKASTGTAPEVASQVHESEEDAKAKLLALEKRNMATVAMRRASGSGPATIGGRGGARRPSSAASDLEDHVQHVVNHVETKPAVPVELDSDFHNGHHVQIQMPKPNIMAGRGRGGRGGRGSGVN